MRNLSFKEIEKIIKKAKRILVATHQGPDGDAIGSLSAMGFYLRKIGKKPYLLCISGVPESLKFVPGAKLINSKHPKTPFDLIAGLDYGSKWRLGLDSYLKKYPKTPLLVFDHHLIMDQGADSGIIDPDYSSTSEMIYDYFKAIRFKIDKKIAFALAVGILADTGYFKLINNSKPLRVIAELMDDYGIKIVEIDNAMNGHIKLGAMRLGGKILNRAQCYGAGNFCYSWLKRRELSKHHFTIDDVRGLIERIKNLREGRFALFLMEDSKGKIRGELRGRPDKNYDVAKLAMKLGGGGHKYAAGFRFRGTIDGALKAVTKYAKI